MSDVRHCGVHSTVPVTGKRLTRILELHSETGKLFTRILELHSETGKLLTRILECQ